MLTAKLEEEKNRQRERRDGSNMRDRSRSKSMTIQNIQKYSNEIHNRKQAPLVRKEASPNQDKEERSVSPYQRWKMMPRQIVDPKP